MSDNKKVMTDDEIKLIRTAVEMFSDFNENLEHIFSKVDWKKYAEQKRIDYDCWKLYLLEEYRDNSKTRKVIESLGLIYRGKPRIHATSYKWWGEQTHLVLCLLLIDVKRCFKDDE